MDSSGVEGCDDYEDMPELISLDYNDEAILEQISIHYDDEVTLMLPRPVYRAKL